MTIIRQRLLAAAGLLLAVLAAGVPVRAWLGERAMSAGRQLQGRGDLLAATERYEAALRRGRPEAAGELARLALLRRRWDEAETYARRSLALAPANSHPHLLLASLAVARPGEWDDAREELVLGECRIASGLERFSSRVWRDRGALELDLVARRREAWDPERLADVLGTAEASYARAAALAPRAASRTLGSALERGAYPMFVVRAAAAAEGRVALRAAVGLLIGREVWAITLPDYLLEAGGRGEMKRFALAAAEALAAAGRPGEAVEIARRAPAADPADAESWHVLGVLLRRVQLREEAAAALLRAAELAPDNPAYLRAAGLPVPAPTAIDTGTR